ncbi:MAG TPA: PDZ domain-containing protein [Tepidisphaeraceae bacterium]|nr:PDZ domain-containing protein [Tepidisphaeraceae bacterium]
MRNLLVVLVLCVAGSMSPRSSAAQSAASNLPTTAPAGDEISKLIAQLDDPDFRVRRQAAGRLRDLGPPALAKLKEAADSNIPEVRTRAAVLVRELEHHPIPGRPRLHSNVSSATLSIVGGRQVIDINDAGRRIRISHGPDGLQMVVTGEVDGRAATETYRAADADELRDKDPDAFALYDRVVRRFALDDGLHGLPNPMLLRGNVLVLPRQQFHPMFAPAGGDDLRALRARLDDQMDKAHVTPEQRRRVADAIESIESARALNLGQNADQDRQIEQYDRACDDLRKAAADLKLPDPGDALPPPKSARLGVSVLPEGQGHDGIVVAHVVARSRADRMGVQDDDLIRRVDGKPVHDVAELREFVTKQPRGLVMEIRRDGRELTLHEK